MKVVPASGWEETCKFPLCSTVWTWRIDGEERMPNPKGKQPGLESGSRQQWDTVEPTGLYPNCPCFLQALSWVGA